MTADALVGVDVGTSGVRVVAYAPDGAVLAAGSADLAERTPDGWTAALRAATPELPDGDVVCSVAGTSGTAVLVDGRGAPVAAPLPYEAEAPEGAAAIADSGVADDLAAKGVPASATSPVAKVLALRRERPATLDSAAWLLAPATWLTYRLRHPEGRRWEAVETDWTNALKFGADVAREDPDWYRPLFEATSLPTDLLPTIRRPGAPVGRAGSDLAAAVGLGGADLHLGPTDGNASALSMGCLEPGDCGVACGSTSVVKYVAGERRPHDALYYHRHPLGGFLAGAAFASGAAMEAVCERWLGRDVPAALELAAETAPGTGPGFFPPGTRSPFFETGMGATLALPWPPGTTADSPAATDGTPETDGGEDDPESDDALRVGRGRLVRGVATGVALAEHSYLPLLEDLFDREIDRVRLLGGGRPGETGFEWWNGLRAAVWDRDVVRMESRTTAGAVLPAAVAAGVYDDAAAASDALLRVAGRPEPESDPDRYADRRAAFRDRWAAARAVHDPR